MPVLRRESFVDSHLVPAVEFQSQTLNVVHCLGNIDSGAVGWVQGAEVVKGFIDVGRVG